MKHAVKRTEDQLKQLISCLNNDLSLSETRWAIVGGYVRDLLISNIINKKISSPDIDIAILGNIPEIYVKKEVKVNSFGGLKVSSDKFGDIDIWQVQNRDELENLQLWKEYLNHIDFGINSVIFCYPEQKLLIHDNWFKTFNNYSISQLNISSPEPELQIVRAFALSIKLKIETGLPFDTNQNCKNRLISILEYSGNDKYNKIINYTKGKIVSKKWPSCVLKELFNLNQVKSYV